MALLPAWAHGDTSADKLGTTGTTAVVRDVPETDRPAGEVYAYRGQEKHGVESPNPYVRGPDTLEIVEEFQPEEPPPLADPIPVIVVNDNGGARQIQSWSANQMSVDQLPRQIVGRNRARTKVTIRNLSLTVTIFIGRSPNGTTALSGYPLAPGVSMELAATDEVCAISPTGALVYVGILQEFTVTE